MKNSVTWADPKTWGAPPERHRLREGRRWQHTTPHNARGSGRGRGRGNMQQAEAMSSVLLAQHLDGVLEVVLDDVLEGTHVEAVRTVLGRLVLRAGRVVPLRPEPD